MSTSEERGPRVMPGLHSLNDVDPEMQKKIAEMTFQSKCLQTEMEGLYRQLYQSCTQQMMVPNFEVSTAMMVSLNKKFTELEMLVASYEQMTKQENDTVN